MPKISILRKGSKQLLHVLLKTILHVGHTGTILFDSIRIAIDLGHLKGPQFGGLSVRAETFQPDLICH